MKEETIVEISIAFIILICVLGAFIGAYNGQKEWNKRESVCIQYDYEEYYKNKIIGGSMYIICEKTNKTEVKSNEYKFDTIYSDYIFYKRLRE